MTTLSSSTGSILVIMKTQSHAESPWLLLLSWLVFVPILYSNYRQAFVISSNMNWKYKKRFIYLSALFIASIVLSFFSTIWATVVVGVPAGLVVLYCLFMMIYLIFGKVSWH